jgi:drug/metabolite transporter (DMT)-like permease
LISSVKQIGWETLPGIIAIFTWAFFATAIKLSDGINPFLLLGIIYCTGATTYVIYWSRQSKFVLVRLRKTPIYLFLLPIIGIGLHDMMWVLAIRNAPAGEVAIIVYQWPPLIVLLTAILSKKRLKLNEIMGVVLCCLGIVAAFYHSIDINSSPIIEWKIGHSYAVISTLTWSIYSAIINAKKVAGSYIKHFDDRYLLGINYIVMGLFSMTLWLTGSGQLSELNVVVGNISLLLMAFLVSVSYMSWGYSLKHGNNKFLIVCSFLTPIMSVCFLVFFTDLEWSISLGLAISMVAMGMYISAPLQKML